MATGKTNARFYRFLSGSIDISGDSRQIGEFGKTVQTAPAEGWSDGVQYFTLGHSEHVLTGYQAVFNNTANTGSHTRLSSTPATQVISLPIGIRAAPAIGDPAFLATFDQVSYTVDGTDAILVNAEFVRETTTDIDHEAPWGVVLYPDTSLTATINAASVDNGASSASGALAHIHVTASDGGTWAFKVQDSSNDSDWSDLITFSADGTTATAERGDVAGTVDQYLRFQATRTSGTCTAWCTLARQ